jgi:hypothetical protein
MNPALWHKTHTITWYPDQDNPSPPPYDQMLTADIMKVENGTCYSLQDWIDDNISILLYDDEDGWLWWDGSDYGDDPTTRTGTPSPDGLTGRVEIQAVLPPPEPDPAPEPPPPPPPPVVDPVGWHTTHRFFWEPVDTETYGFAQTVDLMVIVTDGLGIAYTRESFPTLTDEGVHWTREDGWTFSGLASPYDADATWTMTDIDPPAEML